jgi:excisionase family DNA binding protein
MELMTVQETARLLRVSPVTVRRFIASRRLPAVRVGRGVRVRREDVEKLPAAVGAPGMTTRHRKHGGLFTKDDALWRIVGIGSDEASDVSENKYKYLAEAYADLHEEA